MYFSKRAKLTSKKPLYKSKIKTDNGFVWTYSDSTISKRWEEKKKKLQNLEKNILKLQKEVEKTLDSDNQRDKAIGAIIILMIQTGIRIGNEESAKSVKTYGATTLLKKHVKIDGSKITLNFIGKDNVKQHLSLKDSKVAKVIKELIKNKGPSDRIFEVDGKVIWDRSI